MFKIVKKIFSSTIEGYTNISKGVKIYGTEIGIAIDEKATDMFCTNLVSFLTDCGRKDVRYDMETNLTWIYGIPCLIYVVSSNTDQKAVGVRFPYGLVSAVGGTVTPTSTSTTAYNPYGGFILDKNTGSYEIGFRFIGSESGPFVFAIGNKWYRYRSSTSTSTWSYSRSSQITFNNLPFSYVAFCNGKNILTGSKSVFFGFGKPYCACVDIEDDGSIYTDFIFYGSNGLHTADGVASQNATLIYTKAFTNGIKKMFENGKFPLVKCPISDIYHVHEIDSYCYFDYCNIPKPICIQDDAVSLFSVGEKTFWVNRVFDSEVPGTNNVYLNSCYNPFFGIVDVTEG